MDKPLSIFEISGRAMSASSCASTPRHRDLANAGAIAGSENQAYRAIRPVFRTVSDQPGIATVQVDRVVTSDTPATKRHDPNHPLADKNGDVWEAGVDTSSELVDMVEASRQYQNNVQVMQTAKSLMLETIRLGK